MRDGDGVLQHLRNLALRISDRLEVVAVLVDELLVALSFGVFEMGKLVLALRPLISTAASSYARAASSAVSNVPSQTLLFLVIN